MAGSMGMSSLWQLACFLVNESMGKEGMNIHLNGNAHTLAENTLLAQLVDSLGLAGKRIAVELNNTIVPRSAHATTVLAEGDCVEIVHAIGGG